MRFLRRALCAAAAGAVIGAGSAALAQAVDHLTIVAPAAPGGGWDQTARALQHVIDIRDLARVVEVQNVPGAAGTIGLSQFVDSQSGRGDALLVTGLVMLGATLWNDSPVTIDRATPIARLTGEYEVIAVPASSPLGDMRELIGEFRRRPDAFAWGGGSAGGTDHILAGLVAEAAGVDPRRVNYVAFSGGGEAVAALLGGHVAAGISGYSEFAPHISSGRLRALAISAPSRLPGIPVPTLAEGGVALEMANWRGLLAPSGISTAQRAALTTLVHDAVRTDDWRRIVAEREWTDQYLDGAGFTAFLDAETTRYQRIVGRLRGPAGSQSAAGRMIFPVAVFAGAALTLIAFIVRRLRKPIAAQARDLTTPASQTAGTLQSVAPANRQAVSRVALALVVFVALLRPLGFVGAAGAMFVLVVRAFERTQAPGATVARRGAMTVIVVAAVFCLLVYFGFTRGLDLPLPRGTLHPWTR